MRLKRRLGGTIALAVTLGIGLGVAGCGGDSTTIITTTTTGVSPSSTDTPSTSSEAKGYVGTTSQDLQISFTATSTEVQSVSFGWRATCDDGQVHTNTIRLGTAEIHDGSFSADGQLDTGGIAHVDGKIEGDTASGNLSRSGPSAFNTKCLTTGVTWQADAASP